MKLQSCIALGSIFLAGTAFSHHGSNGQFNHEVDVDVTGTVTKLSLVNPHSWVYFDVVGEDGEIQNWRCEMRAGSAMKRAGWTEEMFAPGTQITIHGSQARREEHGCYTRSVTWSDGTTIQRNATIENFVPPKAQVAQVELSGDVPNLNGNWVGIRRARGGAPGGQAGGMGAPGGQGGQAGAMGAPAQGGQAGGMGAQGGERGGAPRSRYAQSEAGIAAVEGFDREKMNPRFHCQATNIFHDWTFDEHVNKIRQTDDEIVITYGFMDIVRTIHLNMDEHPADITPSRAGHSIGKWEDDVLVVDTIGFAEGYLEGTFQGVKHSDQMHVTERFQLSEDGNTLQQTYVINDPLYLTASYEGALNAGRTDAAYDEYNCEDLTEEVVEGF